jgi:hypothetical protein
MTILVFKNPSPETRATVIEDLGQEIPEGFERLTQDEFNAWLAEQPPMITPEAVPSIEDYQAAIQAMLDAAAKAKGYDDILSACSYAGAPNYFQGEGKAYVAWRGNVWAYCYTLMASPPEIKPTVSEFVAQVLTAYPAP